MPRLPVVLQPQACGRKHKLLLHMQVYVHLCICSLKLSAQSADHVRNSLRSLSVSCLGDIEVVAHAHHQCLCIFLRPQGTRKGPAKFMCARVCHETQKNRSLMNRKARRHPPKRAPGNPQSALRTYFPNHLLEQVRLPMPTMQQSPCRTSDNAGFH